MAIGWQAMSQLNNPPAGKGVIECLPTDTVLGGLSVVWRRKESKAVLASQSQSQQDPACLSNSMGVSQGEGSVIKGAQSP